MMLLYLFIFFFNDTATTEIYTLSLHDALPIFGAEFILMQAVTGLRVDGPDRVLTLSDGTVVRASAVVRSEEHTSELQSRQYLVCRLLLEKKKKTEENYSNNTITHNITCCS